MRLLTVLSAALLLATACAADDTNDDGGAGGGGTGGIGGTGGTGTGGTGGTLDHAGNFPITSGAHAGLACDACHASRLGGDEVTCTRCHHEDEAAVFAAHQAAGGFEFETAACLFCHADGAASSVAAHEFPITSGENHYRRPCGKCHADRRDDRPYEAIDFATHSCTTSCHQGAHNQTRDCLQCHPDGD
jgi:hypothetical protein